MAEPIVRSFVIDTTESEQNLKELNTTINATDAAINKGAQAFDNVAVAQEEVVASSKSLKAQLNDLQAQLANTEPDSAKYRELATEAGELKNRISSLATVVGTQAGSAFERIGGSLELVKSSIANLDFKGAAENAKLLATNISAVKPAELANGFKSLGSAFLSVGKALLTNPLFLLGSAIVLIVTNLDKLANVIPGVGAVLEAIGNVVSFIVDGVKSLSDAILGTEFVANDALNKSLEQRDKALKEFDQQEKRAIANAKKNGESVAAVEEKYAQERINTYQKILDEAAYLTSQGVKLTEEQVKGVEEANAALFDIETQQIQKQAELAEQARKQQEAKEQEASNRRKQNAQKRADEEKARKQKELEDQRKAEEAYYAALAALEDEQFEKTLTQNERDELAITKKYENLFAIADAAGKDTIALQTQLNDELLALQQKQVQEEIAKEAEKERLKAEAKIKANTDYFTKLAELQDAEFQNSLTDDEKEIDAINKKYEELYTLADAAGISTLDLQKRQAAEITAVEEQSAQQRKANEFAVQDAKLQATSDALGAINGLVAAFAKGDEKRAKAAFKIQKAVSIAQATVDTYKGANAIFANAAANPSTILFPAQPFIAAGVAIASGLANVATIAQQQFQGGSASGGGGNENPPSLPGGGGGDTGSQPAQFNPLASSFLQDRPEQLTPRAYVLAGDVASQQEVRTKVEDLSRIG